LNKIILKLRCVHSVLMKNLSVSNAGNFKLFYGKFGSLQCKEID
jgi:hypothetical protein